MWRADLVRVRTGELGARLAVTPSSDLTDELNAIPSGSVKVAREHAARIDATWWEPWRNGLVFRHRHDPTEEWRPMIAGPLVRYPSITAGMVQLDMAGIQEILRRRVLVHEWTDYPAIEAWKPAGPWWEGSLGQIAWNVVQLALAKPRGGLPIVHGTPDEHITDATRAGRGWHNWDVGNLNVWDKVLKGICEDDNGPDLRFTPHQVDDTSGRHIQWAFEHGTHHDPHIAHSYTLRLDATANDARITDLSVTMSGHDIAHRVYGSGAGEGSGTEIRLAERIETATDDMPLLETTVADTSRTAWQDVVALAEGRLSPGGMGAWKVSCRVQTDQGMPLWKIRPGAPVDLKVRGLAPFPQGWVRGRIAKASYSLKSDVVSVDIEEAI